MDFPAEGPAVAAVEAGKRYVRLEEKMNLATRHFVRPEAHNHHNTLYAGRLADWLTEAAMIGVTKLLGRNDHVVLAALEEIRITRPMKAGMILEFQYEISHLGTTSIVIFVSVSDMLTGDSHATGSARFVTVDADGRKTPHFLEKGVASPE